MSNNETKNEQKPKVSYAVFLGLELGFFIVAPLLFFLLLGLYLDKKFDTLPLFLISFIVLSLVASIFEVRYLIVPFLEKRSQNNKSTKN